MYTKNFKNWISDLFFISDTMDNLPVIYTIIYNEQDSKVRLDKFLAQNVPQLSRTKIKKLIEIGALKLNGIVTKESDLKLILDDVLLLEVPQENTFNLTPMEMELDIVFEDDDLLIINKPSGLTVHPGAGNHNDTLVNALVGSYEGKLSNASGSQRPGIVHRLDKDTSGLMVIAKNDSTHYALSTMLASREIKRSYQALVFGTPHPHIGTITTQYGRSKRDPKKMCVLRGGGRVATTHYKVLEILGNGALSLIECNLETGRTHQIRVHMEHKNHPIVGDQVYGRSKNFNLNAFADEQSQAIKKFPRQALHAYKLEFTHPKTGEALSFESALPADIGELLELLIKNLS
jgi:23S rRNA pseudouridine1911/1915/1917 synthase